MSPTTNAVDTETPSESFVYANLIVVFLTLEIAALLAAYRALAGSRLATVYVAAFTALPYFLFLIGEHSSCLNAFEKLQIAFLMTLFNGCDELEMVGDTGKSFLFSHTCELKIQICPFLMLACGCLAEIACGISDRTGRIRSCDLKHSFIEEAEKSLCMGIFLFSCLKEDSCDLFITFLLCHFGKNGITTTCLRFAGE